MSVEQLLEIVSIYKTNMYILKKHDLRHVFYSEHINFNNTLLAKMIYINF